MEGVKSWVAYIDAEADKTKALANVEVIAGLTKSVSTVQNVAIILTNANEMDEAASKEALKELQGDDDLTYTLVLVGKIEDHAEGAFTTDIPIWDPKTVSCPILLFTRATNPFVWSELLQLEAGTTKALAITETRLIKRL